MKADTKLVGIALCLLGGLLPSLLAAQPAPEIEVPVCQVAPQIDADLNDPCWKQAAKLTGFHLVTTGKEVQVQTTAWLCRDDTWLYIAIRCDEPKPGQIKRKVSERDGSLSADDSVEVFIDPGHNGKEYYHCQLSAGNVQADQRVRGDHRARYWDLPWRSAALVDPHIDTATGWSAEMAIPLGLLHDLAGPGPWRMNICRSRWTVSPTEYTSWAPLPPGSGFHTPEGFQVVKGLTGFKAELPFGPMLGEVGVSPFEIAAGKYAYTLKVQVKNETGRGGRVELIGQDVPQQGEGIQVGRVVELGPMDKQEIALRLEVPSPGPRSAWVGLREPGTEFWLQKAQVRGMEKLIPFDAYLDRNYYTTEKQAQVYAEISISREDRLKAGLNLQARLLAPDGKVIATGRAENLADDEASISLPLGKVPNGESLVSVSLLDRNKQPLGAIELPLIKRPPAPQGVNEVKIDRYNRCLLINGEPFFPHGICSRFDEKQLGYSQEAGFNIVVDWSWSGSSTIPLEYGRKGLDLARENGLYVIGLPLAYVGPIAYYGHPQFREKAEKLIAGIDDYMKMARVHPATIGYYGFDEPSPGIPMKGKTIEQLLKEFYDRLHGLAPYHLLYMSLCRVIREPKWFDVVDLLGTHNYWEASDPKQLDAIAQWSEQVDRHARAAHGPTMLIVNSEVFHTTMPMTHEERRATVYLSLVHGAKSLIYFAAPIRHEMTLESMKEISQEIKQLGPILVTRTPAQEVTFEPKQAYIKGWSPDLDFPIVQVLLKNHPKGGQVLLAVNGSFQPVNVRFRVASLGARSRVSDFFGKKTYPIKGGAFSDKFEPLERHVYLLKNTRAQKDTPVGIHLIMSGQAVEEKVRGIATPEIKANLVGNAGFEQEGQWDGEWSRDGEQAHSGKYCLKISKEKAEGYADVRSQPVTLKPKTKYRFGGWVRCDLSAGRQGPHVFFYDVNTVSSGKNRLNSRTSSVSVSEKEWKFLSAEVTTPDEPPVQARLWCRVPTGCVGQIWFDDVFVEEIGATAEKRNLVRNSSFEGSRLPGWADFWHNFAFGHLKPDPKACGTDEENPYHGKQCFRIPSPKPGAWGAFASQAGLPLKRGKSFTLSAYLRAEYPKTRVRFAFAGQQEHVEVDTEWKRYWFTVKIPEEGSFSQWRSTDILIRHYGQGTLWADAVQFEEGEEPTPYQPSD